MSKAVEARLPKLCARCGRPLPLESNECLNCGVTSSRSYRRSTVIAIWVLCSIGLFAVAGVVSRAYDIKREELADRWFERGRHALQVSQPENAIGDFRNALAYSPHNAQYRLQLAEALLADPVLSGLLATVPGTTKPAIYINHLSAIHQVGYPCVSLMFEGSGPDRALRFVDQLTLVVDVWTPDGPPNAVVSMSYNV